MMDAIYNGVTAICMESVQWVIPEKIFFAPPSVILKPVPLMPTEPGT